MTESTASRVVPGISLDDHALLAEQPIDQRRLAGVRPADDRDRELDGFRRSAGRRARGSRSTIASSRSPTPSPCSAAISNTGSNPSSIELERTGARASIVGLVDGEQRGFAGVADHLGDFLVARHQAFAAIRHEHKEIGVGDRAAAAFEHERMQRILAGAEHAAGIDQLEMGALPLDRLGNDVARRARDRRDDGAPRACEAVEQRRFPDIGAADEDDGGQGLWRQKRLC